MANIVNKLQLLGLGLIIGACLIQGSIAQTRSIDPAVQKQIDDFIKNWYFPNAGISKMGLTVVQDDGEILYTTGYGLSDEEKGIPNTNQTQFLIGSTSKSFTSLVVIKVLSELFPEMGEAVLDTPIRTLMPAVNFTLIDRFRSEHATFRDLISHRMCIFRDDWQLMIDPFNTTAEVVYRQRYAEEICGMRTEFQYNNQMYIIAGELIGILSNSSYTELIQNLFADLGMVNSNLTSKSDDFSNMPYRGQPYYVLNNISYPYSTDLVKRVVLHNAAGGLYIPPNDMARYMRFYLNKGSIDGKQIIPESVMAWMTKPSFGMPADYMVFKSSDDDLLINTFAYGLGLMLASYDGWQHIHHGGYFPPYHTLMSLFPGKNLGVFTSTNEGLAQVDASIIHAFVFEVLRGSTNATEKSMKLWVKEKAIKAKKDMKKEKALQKFFEHAKRTGRTRQAEEIVGKYGSGGSGDAEIMEKFNEETNATGLYVSYGQWGQGWMNNIGGSLYQITWATDLVQDSYAGGDPLGYGYAKVENETLEFVVPYGEDFITRGTFKLGVSLAILPPIPWNPGSCGPETK